MKRLVAGILAALPLSALAQGVSLPPVSRSRAQAFPDVTVNGAALSWVVGQVVNGQTSVVNPSPAFWDATSGGGSPNPGPPTVTADTTDVADPAGGFRATKIAFPAVSGSGFSVAGNRLNPNGNYGGSVFLRTASGTATVYLMTTPDGITYQTVPCAVSASWSRCVLPVVARNGATIYFQLGVDLRDSQQSAQSALTVYVWGAWFSPDA